MRLALAAFLSLLPVSPVLSADAWTASRVDGSANPAVTVGRTVPETLDGLPDGRIVFNTNGGTIHSAWYARPTTRYGHGILGDRIEAGALVVRQGDGETVSLTLPEDEVFEDLYPRLADLDGDGTTEVITIRSSLSQGASVTVYGMQDGRLVENASTGYIGHANRWLNIAGIARFSGTGSLEIAFVRTPHIGGTLFIYRFRNGRLRRIASLDGFSNHQIGSRELRLSAVADLDGDGKMELALPSDNRATLRIVGLGKNGLSELASVVLPARIDKAIAVSGTGGSTRFTVGLDDASVFDVKR